MKLGWIDFKYISTHPVVSRRTRDGGKRINSMDALWYKIGYEVYQHGHVESPNTDHDLSRSTEDPEAPLITPETALEHKLDYDVYRSEASEATSHRHSARTIYDHGLGRTRGEMAHLCSELRGEHALCETILFSSDPAALALLDKSEQVDFTRDCTATFIETMYQQCFGIENVDFSFVLHEKPDRDGRDRLHAHITVAGTYYDEQTHTRQSMPFVNHEHITQMQAIADRVVEQELDLYFGREWRWCFPEYEKTYQMPSAALADVPLDLQLGILLEAPLDGFGDEADIARLVEELFGELDFEEPAAPSIPADLDLELAALWEAPLDNFGDEADIARLVVELFGELDFEEPTVPSTTVPKRPIPNELDTYFPRPTAPIPVPEQPLPGPQVVKSERFQYEDRDWYASSQGTFGVHLDHDYDEAMNTGWLTLSALWRDPQTEELITTSEHIFDSHFTNYLPFNGDTPNVAQARAELQNDIENRYTSCLKLLHNQQFDRMLRQCHATWFETTATRDPDAVFLAELPDYLLPFDAQKLPHKQLRLPELDWIAHPKTSALYAFTIGELDDGSPVLDVLKQWSDGGAVYQIQRMPFYPVPDDPYVQAGTLNNLVLHTRADFADGMRMVQKAWGESFAQPGELFLLDGPTNPFPMYQNQSDVFDLPSHEPLMQSSIVDETDDELSIDYDIDFD